MFTKNGGLGEARIILVGFVGKRGKLNGKNPKLLFLDAAICNFLGGRDFDLVPIYGHTWSMQMVQIVGCLYMLGT